LIVLSFFYLKNYCYTQSHPSVLLLHSGSFTFFVLQLDIWSILITFTEHCKGSISVHFSAHCLSILFQNYLVRTFLFALNYVWSFATDHFIVLYIIYSCMYTLFGPIFPCLPHPSPFTPLTSRKNLFHSVFQFYWRENIRDNKKDLAFLLAWDKGSNTEIVLVLLPYTCVLQPKSVHLYHTSSLLPGHFSTVASVSFRLFCYLLSVGTPNTFKF
jgi:hypothetical protein